MTVDLPIPARAAPRAFDDAAPRGKWPPFPWNPADLDNPLIGREEALEALARAYDDVVGDWVLRVQLLLSDYGLGKSRLLSVFVAAAKARDPNTLAIEVRCPSSGGGGGPYRLWDAVLRAAFGISPEADAAEAGLALERAIERWVPSDVAALVAHLVGLPISTGGAADEEALMARCIGALGRLFEAIALDNPVLVVVDDANRASARDFALASALAATLKGRPVMLVLAGSPNLADHLPGWDRFPLIRLEPLDRQDTERMLRLFLTGLATPPSRELVDRLVAVSGGNAYALKAVVRWLHEAGAIRPGPAGKWVLDEAKVQGKDVPDTLEGVMHARLSALAPAERELLGQAAVIGREFWFGTLVAIARQGADPLALGARADADTLDWDGADGAGQGGAADAPARIRATLGKLVAQRVIETRTSRIRGEECFGFRSGAHWEAALESLPTTTLQRWHRIVLAWLELQSDAPDPMEGAGAGQGRGLYLRELARHAEGAGQPALAAIYHLRAARLALAEGHSRAALTSLEEALRLVQPDQLATRLRILFELGEVHALAGTTDLAVDYFHDALSLAWRLGDRKTGATALAKIAEVEMAQGAYVGARKHLLEALRLFEAIQDPHGVAATCVALGRLHWLVGELDKALLVYRKSEHIYRRLGYKKGIGEVLHAQGAVHFDRGDVPLAEAFYQEALALRKACDDTHGLVRTLNNLGCVWMGQKLERSAEVWREALEIARELGDLGLHATIADNLGEVLVLLGRHDEADAMLDRAVELAEITGRKSTLVDALRNQAQLRIATGQWDRAEAALARARAEAQPLGLARLDALVLRTFGDLEIARLEATGVVGEREGAPAASPLDRAESAYRRAAQGLEGAGYDLEAATTVERLADALGLAGKKAESEAQRERARRLRAGHSRRASPPPIPT
ncbi:MAG: tetratricopeptide repeat protein [Deltaproteobacteria bacterium]|nr:tetratricopeptide repeat protein [Deltaproteobacteria bacterium]